LTSVLLVRQNTVHFFWLAFLNCSLFRHYQEVAEVLRGVSRGKKRLEKLEKAKDIFSHAVMIPERKRARQQQLYYSMP